MTSDEPLVVDHVPASLAIVGGGVMGCEFASVFARLGTKVAVIEMLDQLLPGEDKRTGRTLQAAFTKLGSGSSSRPVWRARAGDRSGVKLRLADGTQTVAEAVLVAVGRRPLSGGLGDEQAGVEISPQGFVVTDDTTRTRRDGAFAVGDVAGPPLLAHWAYHQGVIAAEAAVPAAHHLRLAHVPACSVHPKWRASA